MSAQSTPEGSPLAVQPLHHPEHAAHVHAPLGNATNAPGAAGKALLAKKLAAANAAYVSPSDAIMTPCTARLNQVKKKHFNKGKPIRFALSKATPEEDERVPTNNSPLAQQQQHDSDMEEEEEEEEDAQGENDEMEVEPAAAAAPATSRLQPAEF